MLLPILLTNVPPLNALLPPAVAQLPPLVTTLPTAAPSLTVPIRVPLLLKATGPPDASIASAAEVCALLRTRPLVVMEIAWPADDTALIAASPPSTVPVAVMVVAPVPLLSALIPFSWPLTAVTSIVRPPVAVAALKAYMPSVPIPVTMPVAVTPVAPLPLL